MVEWTKPNENGNALTGYTVIFHRHDTNWLTLAECDMSSSPAATQCTFAQSLLEADPFNLEYGEKIEARIIATNERGNSL